MSGGADETAVDTHLSLRALAAEAVGTAFLLAGVVGSGIMGAKLADGNVGLALLGNTVGTGALLTVLILIFGPISGAHFNPAVTLAALLDGRIGWRAGALYGVVQIIGAFAGVVAAHLMFDLTAAQVSSVTRAGTGQLFSEVVATFGLVGTILAVSRHAPTAVPYAVGLFITAGYWFTASTSFANPAVTLARAATDTFAGVAPVHVPGFIAAQVVGAVLAVGFFAWLLRKDA